MSSLVAFNLAIQRNDFNTPANSVFLTSGSENLVWTPGVVDYREQTKVSNRVRRTADSNLIKYPGKNQ